MPSEPSAEAEKAKLRAAADAIRKTAFLSDNNRHRLNVLESAAIGLWNMPTALEAARAKEREEIVGWLKGLTGVEGMMMPRTAADAIASLQHKEGER